MFGLAVLARLRSILDSGGRMQSELTARRFCWRFGGSSRISHWTRSGGFRFVSRAGLLIGGRFQTAAATVPIEWDIRDHYLIRPMKPKNSPEKPEVCRGETM